MPKARLGLAAVLTIGLIGAGMAPVKAGAERQIGYVTGVRSPEDLVGIPNSPWIITSGLAEGKRAGSLFLIDRRTKTASDLLRARVAAGEDVPDKTAGWPRNPRGLAGRLRRCQTFLRTVGIDIAFTREGRTGSRMIRMTSLTKSPRTSIGNGRQA